MVRNLALAAVLAGLAFASPAPAPQMLDFDEIDAAPTVATGPTGIAAVQSADIVSTVTVSSAALPDSTGLSKRNLGSLVNAWDCIIYGICSTSSTTTTSCRTTTTSTTSTKTTTTTTTTTTTPCKTATTTTSSTTSCKTSTTSSASTTSKTTTPCTTSSSSVKSSTTTLPSTTISSTSAPSSSSKASSTSVPSTTSAIASSTVAVSSSAASTLSIPSSSTVQSTTGTSTTSSTTACPTTPENGTYCGFINPEDACAPQPDGYGPANLTVAQFYGYPEFKADAINAATEVSSSAAGAVYVQSFADLNASVSANSYIGLYTLDSYDVSGCAGLCDNTSLCTAFNIYIERDPSQNPTANDSSTSSIWGYWCPDPSAITNYKCTLWGSSIDAADATNYGDWREQFEVVVTGSNGYDKTNSTTPSITVSSSTASATSASSVSSSTSISTTASAATTTTTTTLATSVKPLSSSSSSTTSTTSSTSPASTGAIPAWGSGKNCGGKAVNNPTSWMGGKVFPGPYNPQICADYAWSQNAANKAVAVAAGKHTWAPCTYINAVYYHKNGSPYGTYCNLYSQTIDASYQTYSGGWSGSDFYSCEQSWTFELQVSSGFATC